MELRATREMRRNERLAQTAAKKEEGSAKLPAAPQRPQPAADKLTLSRQAVNFLEEQNRKMWEWDQERRQRRQNRTNDSLSALEGSKRQLDDMGKRLKVQNKCQKIAASIIKGNRVPPEDLEYLMNNDPEGYKLAMAMRRPKEHPEDEKSVLDEEDRAGRAAEPAEEEPAGEAAPAPSVESEA